MREFFLFIIIVTLFPLNKMPPWFILVEGQQAFDDKNVEEVRQGKFSYAVFTAWIACTAEFFFIFQHVVSCPFSDFLLPRHGRLGTRGLPHLSTTECSRYGNVTSFTPMNDPATRYALLQSISAQAACRGKMQDSIAQGQVLNLWQTPSDCSVLTRF